MSSLGTRAFSSDPEDYPNPNAEMAMEETTVAVPDIDTDTQAISEAVFNGLAARSPGWVPHDSNLEVWLIEEFSTVAATIRTEAVTVPEAIFQTYGEEVLGIPVRIPAPATSVSTWTAMDTKGYAIPVGTQLSIQRTGDEWVVFEVAVSAAIPVGELTVSGVQIRASDEGAFANGLEGEAEVVDPLAWVDTITIDQPTSEGDDGQALSDYLEDLVQLMRVVALRPILPWDFAVLALRTPGVGRAIAMDGYEPSDGTWHHARQITLVLTDPDGEPCTTETKQAVKTGLEALREVNFIVNVIDAQYLTVNVDYSVTAFAEQDATLVKDGCDQSLEMALSPAYFRLGVTSPSIAAGEVITPPATGNPGRQTLHINDYIGLLDRCRGVDWVDIGTVHLNGQAADVPMPTPITLPRAGTITGVVNVQAMGGGIDFP